MKIGLLGASFGTGNFGVSALAESGIRCILHHWPLATIKLLGAGRERKIDTLEAEGKTIKVENLPIRFCKNIFMWNHYVVLFGTALILKILPFSAVREFCIRQNPYLGEILEMDLVADITGGDSFSDIYGRVRFLQGSLLKYLWILFGIKFYFLPQTYGPYKRWWVRLIAKNLLHQADKIYSRDQQGFDTVLSLFKNTKDIRKKMKVVPDVAFILEPKSINDSLTRQLEKHKQDGKIIVGINVNGLLYRGGYTQNNMFALAIDYPEMIQNTIDLFLQNNDTIILLVPHVCPSAVYKVECDATACHCVLDRIDNGFGSRVLIAENNYDHRSIKYVIGYCDFFLGSRMHSCIAAMSQCIPTVALAYSRKFQGVFKCVGQEESIVDLRTTSGQKAKQILLERFLNKALTQTELTESIFPVQQQIRLLFQDSEKSWAG